MSGIRKCSIKECKSQKDSILKLFSIPEDQKEIWHSFIENCNGPYHWKPKKHSKICSLHFADSCFTPKGKLVKGSIPTILIKNSNTSDVLDLEENVDEMTVEMSTEQIIEMLKSENKLLKSKLNAKNKIILKMKKSNFHYKTIAQHWKNKYNLAKKGKKHVFIQKNSTLSNLSKKIKNKYSLQAKRFSIKSIYYSTKAYKNLRNELDNEIPHPYTIRRWLKHLIISPGFIQPSLNFLEEENKCSNFKKLYCLTLDEIAIRKEHVWQNGKMQGFVNYGSLNFAKPKEIVASSALFVMATCVNGQSKVPIAYFLTKGCSGILISQVIKEAISKMSDINARVIAVTFDGFRSNLIATKYLGANLNPLSPDFKPYFSDPSSKTNIYVTPDICHLVKVLRTTLKKFGKFFLSTNEEVDWKYFEILEKHQESAGLTAANKLTFRHTEFENQKMKVRLAVQLFSSSVSRALTACSKMQIQDFEGCDATAQFVLDVDRIFDICNARACGQGLKAPIDKNNFLQCVELFTKFKKTLLELKIEIGGRRRLLMHTNRSGPVKGFVILLSSIELIAREFIMSETPLLLYLPTYKIGQDVLELFFSSIRRRGGNNNNPNCLQLKAALRTMLSVQIDPSENANCVSQEPGYTVVSSLDSTTTTIEASQLNDFFQDEEDLLTLVNSQKEFSLFENNIICYVSGLVGKKLLSLISCSQCREYLVSSNPTDDDNPYYILIKEKNMGGMFIPSIDLIEMCKILEKIIRALKEKSLSNITYQLVASLSEAELCVSEFYENLKQLHNHGFEHLLVTIRLLIAQYSKIRLKYLAKTTNLKIHPYAVRNQATKSVLFQGQ